MNLIGQQIDNYRIDRLLGEGGMGAVYQAHDVNLARDVALKVMHRQFARQSEFQRRFMQEAQAAARLDHPSIVRIYNFGMREGFLYMVMEYIAGGTLGKYLKRLQQSQQVIRLNETLPILAQVADALDYAHRQGVVHRDIKPDNILLRALDQPDREGDPPIRAVVTDFGLAKLVEGGIQTQTGTFMGTLPYMSPEQCLGKELDGRSDIYSLGVLLYQLTTGQLPFDIKSPTDAVMKHIKEVPPPPRKVRAGIPLPVEAVINQAIAKEPGDRFATGQALAQALRRVSANLTDEDVTQLAPPEKTVSLATQLLPAGTPAEPSRLGLDLTAMPGEARLLVARKGEEARAHPLDKQSLTIGRSADNDITLAAQGISRTHARIERAGDGWRITDLGSTNGTFLDDNRLLPDIPETWPAGQVVRIGDYFLRWQQVEGRTAPSPTALGRTYEAARPAQQPAGGIQPASALGQLSVVVNPASVTVAAGSRADLQVELLNQGTTVDHFTVRLEGLPEEWVTFSQTTAQLLPGARTALSFSVQPPPDSRAAAGQHPYRIVVVSSSNQKEVAATSGQIIIQPFARFTIDARPTRLRNKGVCRITVQNEGNAEATYSVIGRDPADALRFSGQRGRLKLSPGEQGSFDLEIAPETRPWLGGSSHHAFEIQVATPAGEKQTQAGQLEVTPRIPTWLLSLALVSFVLLCLSAAALYAFVASRERDAAAIAEAGTATAVFAEAATLQAEELLTREAEAAEATAIAEMTEQVIILTAEADEEAAATATVRIIETATAQAEADATATAQAAEQDAAAATATAQAVIDMTLTAAAAPTETPTPTPTPTPTETPTLAPVHGGGHFTYRAQVDGAVTIFLQPALGDPIPLVSGQEDAAVLDYTPAHGGRYAIWALAGGSETISLVQTDGSLVRQGINHGWGRITDADWSLDGQYLVVQAQVEGSPRYFYLTPNGDLISQPPLG